MAKSEKISIGAIVEFKELERLSSRPNIDWIDEFDNKIPPGTKGLIIEGKYRRLRDFRGWEYNILIPSLGIVSPNWGKFALKVISPCL
jgi:hypothetical protein